MEVFGITYIIENAQQFWSELDDILHIPPDITLEQLDATMRHFVTFCASYHEQYLHTPMQLEHSCELLMISELFVFHSERMCELLLDDTKESTDPHRQLILYSILLSYGRRNPHFLRSHKRWQPLFPLLMDHIRLDLDVEVEDSYISAASSAVSNATTPRGVSMPIEIKLRLLSVQLLYEASRVQKLSIQELRIFDDRFIDHLFDIVEETRNYEDDSFNYAIIKLIVALNEQFMLASLEPRAVLSPHEEHKAHEHIEFVVSKNPEQQNRVLRILMARLSSTMTFGANLIFMLNRADRTPEDMVMQLLVLKLLYLLFTTKGTADYFYTNDLCVLVDVFLREILDLDENNESLRHTYLRVLHPLLTKTQLCSMPYKRPQIVRTLESLIEHENIRDVNPTTKRLVHRCLSGDWCVQLRQANGHKARTMDTERRENSFDLQSVSSESSSIHASGSTSLSTATIPTGPPGARQTTLKTSRSVENLKSTKSAQGKAPYKDRALGEVLRSGSNNSSISLPKVAVASAHPPPARRRERAGSMDVEVPSASQQDRRGLILEDTVILTQEPPMIVVQSPFSPATHDTPAPSQSLPPVPHSAPLASSMPSSPSGSPRPSHRRPAPPPPSRRRKPPAIPTSKGIGGVIIQTIASSKPSSPLSASARSS